MELLEPDNRILPRFLDIFYGRFSEMEDVDYKTAQKVRSLDEAAMQIQSGTHNYFGNFYNNRPAALLIERTGEPDRFIDAFCSEIEWLVACPYSRGSGRGLLEEYLQENEQEPIRLDVSVENQRAIRLYRDYGFEIVGTYGNKDPMHVMALRI